MTLTLHVTLSISDGQHKWHLAKQRSAIVLSIIMLNVIMLNVIMLSVIMLSVAFYQILCLISLCWVLLCWESRFIYYYAECHFTKCCYAECLYAEWRCAECRYAEWCYAKCRSAECHGAVYPPVYRWQEKSLKCFFSIFVVHCWKTFHETIWDEQGCLCWVGNCKKLYFTFKFKDQMWVL